MKTVCTDLKDPFKMFRRIFFMESLCKNNVLVWNHICYNSHPKIFVMLFFWDALCLTYIDGINLKCCTLCDVFVNNMQQY